MNDDTFENLEVWREAKASGGEVRSQAHIAQRVKLLGEKAAAALIAGAKRLSKRLMRLIEARREKFD